MWAVIAVVDDAVAKGFGNLVGELLGHPWAVLAFKIFISTVPILVLFPALMGLTTWVERKVLARIQNRIGPNRVGPFGLLQFVADGIKMLTKEDIVPRAADRVIHLIAPIVIVIPPFLVLSLLPFGKNMVASAPESGVLLFFSMSAVGTLAIFMAGWASRNKYSVLGAMRAVAQMISYELPLVLSAVPVLIVAGTLSMPEIVASQSGGLFNVSHWNIFTPWGVAGFLIFFVASLAEVNRSPFDLPEAESELVAGHLTEYSGFKYALFFLAEYLSAFAISGLGATLFLGGWNAPIVFGIQLLPGFVWFFVKMYSLILLMIWVRGTFPRLRVDQLMNFAWKFLIPLALLNIPVTVLYALVFEIVVRKVNAAVWVQSLTGRAAGWVIAGGVLIVCYHLLAHLTFGRKIKPRKYRYA